MLNSVVVFLLLAAIVGVGSALLFAGRHWKNVVSAKQQSLSEQLQDLSALVSLADPDLMGPLPWTKRALSPTLLREILNRVCERDHPTVVECGSGISTLFLARALRKLGGGHLFSLEDDVRFADRVADLLRQNGLEAWVTLVRAPLVPCEALGKHVSWYSLAPELLETISAVDILVVDGPRADLAPLSRLPALPTFWPILKSDSEVFLDDASREGEKEVLSLWGEHFPVEIGYYGRPRVLATLSPRSAREPGSLSCGGEV